MEDWRWEMEWRITIRIAVFIKIVYTLGSFLDGVDFVGPASEDASYPFRFDAPPAAKNQVSET